MKILEASRAYFALRKLYEQPVPFAAARAVSSACATLETEARLLENEEYKLVRKHGGKIERGTAVFEREEDQSAFAREVDQLRRREVDVKIAPICIPKGVPLTLSARDYDALADFLEVEL